ncbi:acyltransferase [Stenotrophomonas sp.]|uniref:acyltransferase family protein n=1 Tax=Stenotrophomonas sp. TaxID=69392 RepID=UPI0028AB9F78|nr:acyltransferase [Stenotrophomonas sp.]
MLDRKSPALQAGTSTRFDSLQVLRGIAALAVLIFHLRAVESKYIPGEALLGTVAAHADAGVDLFFVISGFVMAHVGRGRFSGFRAAGLFLMKRAWRVLPLYWLFTTLTIIMMMTFPAIVNSSYPDQSVIKSYLLIPHTQLPVLAVGWTLIHEAYFYVVFAIAIAIIAERALTVCLIGWAAVIAYAHLDGSQEMTPLRQLLISPLTFEFIVGVLAGLHWRKLPRQLASAMIVAGIALYLTGAVGFADASISAPDPWLRTATFGTASVLLVLGWVMRESRGERSAPSVLVALGNSSYSLYLSHVFVISAVGRLWAAVIPGQSWGHHFLFVLVATASACIAGHVIHRCFELPLLNLAHRSAWRRGRVGRKTTAVSDAAPGNA